MTLCSTMPVLLVFVLCLTFSRVHARVPICGLRDRDGLSYTIFFQKCVKSIPSYLPQPPRFCVRRCECQEEFCVGPPWRHGIRSRCQNGEEPGLPESCRSDKRGSGEFLYSCCKAGSRCKAPSKCTGENGDCCCTASASSRRVLSVTNIKYDFDKVSRTEAPRVNALYGTADTEDENNGSGENGALTVTISMSETQTVTFDWSDSIKLAGGASITGTIPVFKKLLRGFGFEASVEKTWTEGESHSTSSERTFTVSNGLAKIAPFSMRRSRFIAKVYSATIPFTADVTMQDDCSEESQDQITGTANMNGILGTTEAELKLIYGRDVPVECNATPLKDVPLEEHTTYRWCAPITKTCQSNPLCKRFDLHGDCCPAPDGAYRSCCATALAHERCNYLDALLCPSATGVFAPCCQHAISGTVPDARRRGLSTRGITVKQIY